MAIQSRINNMKDRYSAWEMITKNLTSLSTVIAGVVTLILVRAGLLSPSAIPLVTLALLILLATSELVDKSRRLEKIESAISDGIDDVLEAVGGATVTKLTLLDDGLDYVAKKIRGSKSTIEHFALHPPGPRWSKKRINYEKAIQDLLKTNRVRFRYIAELRPHRLERLKTLLGDKSIKQFFPAYYDRSGDCFPAMSFMIFDESEVLVYCPKTTGEAETVLALRHPDIVKMYADYFRLLWVQAKPLNTLEELQTLQGSFPQQLHDGY